MQPLIEHNLLTLLERFAASGFNLLRDRIASGRQRIKETVERYIQFAENEPLHNQEAYRLSSLIRAGIALLKNDKEVNTFFEEVTGRGYPHPWRGSLLEETLPTRSPMTILRDVAKEGRTFAGDQDIYEWLVYQLKKSPTDQSGQGSRKSSLYPF